MLSPLVVRNLAGMRPLDAGGAVLIYFPLGDEIDLTPLLDSGVNVAATRTPHRGGILDICDATGALETHRYGFLQPAADATVLAPDDIAVVLTPGLVFDLAGTRLGRGAGYYDELFTRLPQAYRVGVVPSTMVVPSLPRERHDVAMHALVTELGFAHLP